MNTPNSKLVLIFAACVTLVGCAKGKVPAKPTENVGRCQYVNGFSKRAECREYRGSKWTLEAATSDCKSQSGASLEVGQSCDETQIIGECILGSADDYTWIVMPGTDQSWCGSSQRGCEFFGGGIFNPSALCGGIEPGSGGTGLPTFEWPDQVCKPPKAGEAPGQSDGGLVCTWEMISGATEEGRHFEDYASCDRVRTQRPYFAVPTAENAQRDDPRLSDPTYVAELDWVKSQIHAAACVCCHSKLAPEGTSNWYVDQPGNFINGFYDRGIAMGAGFIDTVGFGAFPPEQNNGFHRASPGHADESIFVTTDQARMKKFFLDEAAHRGLTRDQYAGQYGAGPLDAQRFYVPTPCGPGEGVSADGTVSWTQGPARYVYVMEAGASSPGVPPNLDLPEGVRWRFDVPFTGTPVASGTVKYGVAPEGTVQRAPLTGTAQPLVSGTQYYLYVLADIAVPNSRCLFTAP